VLEQARREILDPGEPEQSGLRIEPSPEPERRCVVGASERGAIIANGLGDRAVGGDFGERTREVDGCGARLGRAHQQHVTSLDVAQAPAAHRWLRDECRTHGGQRG